MNRTNESFWSELVRKYQKVENTAPSAAELEKQIEAVTPELLSENEVDAIVRAVSSGESQGLDPEPDFDWMDDVDTSSVEDGVLQLNRNPGASDDDIKQRMNEFRRQALEEGSDDKNDVESD